MAFEVMLKAVEPRSEGHCRISQRGGRLVPNGSARRSSTMLSAEHGHKFSILMAVPHLRMGFMSTDYPAIG
jgi:hypothetical protein